MSKRPKLIHFITGLHADFGGRPFILPHALAILSAQMAYPDHEIRVCYAHEPSGPAWEFVKPLVTPVVVEAPTEIFGRPVAHYAHSADVVRLQQLIAHGGLYFDTDTIVLRPIADLPEDRVVMGMEHDVDGLCNAFIAAPKNDVFLRTWLDRYRDFDQNDWGGHSILLPFKLAQEMADHIHIEPSSSFFIPHWDRGSLSDLFDSVVDTSRSYSIHLWESLSWHWLAGLTPSVISQIDTTYNMHARRVLAAFPDLAAALSPTRWQLEIAVDVDALPDGAADRSPFWYVALHDADGGALTRIDADMEELAQISFVPNTIVKLKRSVLAIAPPTHWTIYPVDRKRQWLAPMTGLIDSQNAAEKEGQ
tara:strand:+ start:17943 stop:19031 length:1089 start_codon:yes stop_codon:yes gene_type:complete